MATTQKVDLAVRGSAHKGTWLGRPGTQSVYTLEGSGRGNQTGLRVIEHKWADEPTSTVRVVTGDGRVKPGCSGAIVEYLRVEGAPVGSGGELALALFADLGIETVQ